jgi:opacity protein-like surface antigen
MQPIIILTGGIESRAGQQSQSLYFENTVFHYQPHSSTRLNIIAGVFVGAEYSLKQNLTWQLGLAYYQSNRSSIHGQETQANTENPDATNLWNYQYKLSSRQLLFENKISVIFRQRYRPYLLAGLGEGFNRAYAFQAVPLNSGEVATAIYTNNSSTSFVYSLGVGVDIDITKQIRAGAGYRYTNLGQINLGQGVLDTGIGGSIFSIPALKSNHINNHEILIQLTYLFQDHIL